MTINVFNFDVQQILQNVTYISWMVPLMNFGSIKGEKILGKLSNCHLMGYITMCEEVLKSRTVVRQAQLICCVLLQATCFDLSTGHL
jgi:hypothetical protein